MVSNAHSSPAVLDIEQTLSLPLHGVKLIEASAGTGKTYTISNLYLRYVLEGRAVNQILVVTFTNAATEELRGRIRERLYAAQQRLEAAEGAVKEDAFLDALALRLRESDETAWQTALNRLRLAVRSMDEAAIFTINGFCQRALTEHAFNSGQAFQLELLRDDNALWEEALKDWWRRETYTLSADRLALLLSVFPGIEDLQKAQLPLRNAAQKTILPQAFTPLSQVYVEWEAMHASLDGLAAQWQQQADTLKEILRLSPALSRSKTSGYRLAELDVSLRELDAYFVSGTLLQMPDAFELLGAGYLHANSTPTKRGSDPQLEHDFFLRCQSISEQRLDLCRRCRIAVLQESSLTLREQVAQQKRSSHTLSYQDQLSHVFEALQGEGGEALARVLRRQFPVAMIDEFQDTDDLQYGIFRRLYLAHQEDQSEAGALIMIGDPKQAIYSFRGGDIFAYAKARQDAIEHYTLDTNWRSLPSMIQAVNAVFARHTAPFVYQDIIAFHPVKASPKQHKALLENGAPVAAMTLWQFGAGSDGKAKSKGALEGEICEAVAQEITRLLIAGQQGSATLGDEALRPGDIAVLVRNGYEGVKLRRALAMRGVSAVTVGRESVYQSEEAKALLLLLRAVVHCQDRDALRQALCSALLGLDYRQIAQRVEAPLAWLQWKEMCRALHEQWRQRGFMAMFYTLLQHTGLALGVAQGQDAERRLTNLLHLGELLQQRAGAYPGFEALLSWYQQQLSEGADEEAELRLENDDALVKIVTIHTSKGLEYPVVFVPFLWSSRPVTRSGKDETALSFHDAGNKACLALDLQDADAWLALADNERLAEDVRLAYVALTRAKAKTYLVWGAAGAKANPEKTALAWLLRERTEVAEPLRDDEVSAALAALVAQADSAIELSPLPVPEHPNYLETHTDTTCTLAAQQFAGSVARDWRISSFSSLARDVHQPPLRSLGEDDNDAILQFAAGSEVGLFLHKLLEELDFQGDVAAQAEALNEQYASDYGFVAAQQQSLVRQWLQNIVHTSLDDKGLRLASLSVRRRLNELEFDFAVERVDIEALNHFLAAHSDLPLSPLTAESFRGMINGIIDLVFEHEGRFYIADYKSNLLGRSLQDYTDEALHKAMSERRYDLQSLLYVLALHRYLKQRVPGYSYRQHMGGAYYLFLRGMRPEHGKRYGVHFERPEEDFIQTLDAGIFGFVAAAGEVPA